MPHPDGARRDELAPHDVPVEAPAVTETIAFTSVPPMRYPSTYLWFVLASSLDVMLTWVILSTGGVEVNPVARLVIDAWRLPGAIAFKFSLVLYVIVVCEIAGRSRDRLGRSLARVSVLVSALPVVYSTLLIAWHVIVRARPIVLG